MITKAIIMKFVFLVDFPLFIPLLSPFLRGTHDPSLLEVSLEDFEKTVEHTMMNDN